MILTQHLTPAGPRWALDRRSLHAGFTLGTFLATRRDDMAAILGMADGDLADATLLPPIEGSGEVWASGVTYRRSLVRAGGRVDRGRRLREGLRSRAARALLQGDGEEGRW